MKKHLVISALLLIFSMLLVCLKSEIVLLITSIIYLIHELKLLIKYLLEDQRPFVDNHMKNLQEKSLRKLNRYANPFISIYPNKLY